MVGQGAGVRAGWVVGKEVGGRPLVWMSDREWVVGQVAGDRQRVDGRA